MRMRPLVVLGSLLPSLAMAGEAEPLKVLQRGAGGDQGGAYLETLFRRMLPRVFPEAGNLFSMGSTMLLACLLVFGFVNGFAIFAVWLERKVSAHMQCRLGPMEVGPHGLLQTVADGIKLMVKEDIIPRLADRALFIMAPVIVFAGVFVRFVPLPFGEKLIASDLNLGLFFIAAVGSVEVLGVIMAGWSSNNKWSLFGTIRTATQMVSYEIPIGVSFVAVVLNSGSLSTMDIAEAQSGWFFHWNCFRDPFLFALSWMYLIAGLAECKRAPFDLPEAESELVSGFHTEYSGMRFAMFFLAEYAAMYLVAAVAAVIFLGGWYSGIPAIDAIGTGPTSSAFAVALGMLIKASVLVGKALAVVFVQMWVRWTLPRVRLDQMMYLCLKVLLPVSLACLVGTALWRLLFQDRFFFGILS